MSSPSTRVAGAITRPEHELLLCCARARLNAETIARIRALLQIDVDWAYLLQTAQSHGMMPLLYWHLNSTCPESIPKDALDQLRDHFHATAQRNLFLTGELLMLLKLFEAHGIQAVPYKGPALGAAAYGNLSLRQFRDLDILVRKRDVLSAKDLLIAHGYRPSVHVTQAQEAAYLRSQYEYEFLREDGKVVAVSWSAQLAGDKRVYFSFFAPPTAFRDGANAAQIYRIRG